MKQRNRKEIIELTEWGLRICCRVVAVVVVYQAYNMPCR